MITSLITIATSRPRAVLFAAFCLMIAAGAMIPRIGLRLDGRSLIPEGDPTLAAGDSAARAFGLSEIVVLAVVAEEGGTVLGPDGLQAIGRLGEELRRLPGVDSATVTSVATLPLIGRRNGAVEPDEPLGSARPDAERVERVRVKVAALGLRNGVFISADGRAGAVYAFTTAGADREALLDSVEAIVGRADAGFTVYAGGNALAQAELGRGVARDLFILVPFLLATLFVLMTIVFRTPTAALVSLAEIGISLVLTAGLVGALGGSVFITTLVLPVVLIAIGVTDDIYALNRYITALRAAPNMTRGPEHARLVAGAFAGVARPITMTALTTMAGLLSLTFANLEPLRVFGIFGAVSIAFSTMCTFSVVPALLVLLPMRQGSGVRSNARLARAAAALLGVIERLGPRRIVIAAVPLVIAAAFVAAGLRIDDSWIGNLPSSSLVVEGDAVINKLMAGSTTVEVSFSAAGGMVDSAAFAALARVERRIASAPGVGAVQSSLSDVLRITATLADVPFDEFGRRVAGGTERLTQGDIETALAIDESLGRPSIGRYLSEDGRAARMTIFVHGADYERLRPVFESIAGSAREMLTHRIETTSFGDGWISYLTVKLLVEGQIISIIFAALVDFLLVALFLRSIRGAVVAVVPVMASVLFTFAILVLTGQPLGIASSMFASIALGIGVDYSIHLTSEVQQACASAADLRTALREAYRSTASSILASAGAITIGFGLLLLSAVAPNRMLGLLVCISLSVCAMMTLVLVPGLASFLRMKKSVTS